jgi:hypothetical protein
VVDLAPIRARIDVFLLDRGDRWRLDRPDVRARNLHLLGMDLSCAWFLAHAADDLEVLLQEVTALRAALAQAYTETAPQ